MYNVRVGCLLTSRMWALYSSWLYFTVEWSMELTLRYTTPDIRCRDGRCECDCEIMSLTDSVHELLNSRLVKINQGILSANCREGRLSWRPSGP